MDKNDAIAAFSDIVNYAEDASRLLESVVMPYSTASRIKTLLDIISKTASRLENGLQPQTASITAAVLAEGMFSDGN